MGNVTTGSIQLKPTSVKCTRTETCASYAGDTRSSTSIILGSFSLIVVARVANEST